MLGVMNICTVIVGSFLYYYVLLLNHGFSKKHRRQNLTSEKHMRRIIWIVS